MQTLTIPAHTLTTFFGREVAPLGGGVRVAAGGHGYALYGPYCAVAAGVYRVIVDAALVQRADAASVFDVYANGRIQFSRFYREPFELVAFVESAAALEVRFRTRGEAVDVRSVQLKPLWLDASSAPPSTLVELLAAIADDDVEARAVLALCDRLADAGEPALAEALRHERLVDTPMARARRAWRSIHAGAAPQNDGVAAATRAQIAPIAAAEVLATFDLFSLTPEDGAALGAFGYDPQWLEATARRRAYDEPQRRWQQRGDADPAGPSAQMLKAMAETDLSFQYALARGQGVTAYSPLDGKELRSDHGFLVAYAGMCFMFYRFEASEVFYLCAGEASGGKSFLYFPRTSCIVLIMNPTLRWYPKVELIYRLHVDVLANAELAGVYLRGSTRMAAVLSNNNMGHFIWNELNGVHDALGVGLQPNLAAVVQLPGRFLPVAAVFPEFAAGVVRDDEPASAGTALMAAGLTPVRFTDVIFYPDFAARLQRAALRNATPAAPPAEFVRPLLWINLRVHTKMWVEQVEAYAHILNTVYAEYGAASALLDGWADCGDVAREIRARLDPGVVVYDGLTLPLFDSIAWALAVDAYVCTIGSGLVLLTWIAAKEGVAHAERAHMEQLDWWSDVRPDAPPPLAPPLDAITDVDAGPLGMGLYCNYHLDREAVLTPLREILDRSFARVAPRDAPAVGSATEPTNGKLESDARPGRT